MSSLLTKYCVYIQGIHELSSPLLLFCSLGQEKHILQYEHESEVNIYPSICQYVFLIMNSHYSKIIYTIEIKYFVHAYRKDGWKMLLTKFKTYFKMKKPFKLTVANFTKHQWLNENINLLT